MAARGLRMRGSGMYMDWKCIVSIFKISKNDTIILTQSIHRPRPGMRAVTVLQNHIILMNLERFVLRSNANFV